LGIDDFAVYLIGRQIDKARRDFDQQRLELQPLLGLPEVMRVAALTARQLHHRTARQSQGERLVPGVDCRV